MTTHQDNITIINTNNNEKVKVSLKELHLLINRCDVIKDAKEVIDKEKLLIPAMNQLFPLPGKLTNISSNKTQLDEIEDTVLDPGFQGGQYGAEPLSLSTIKPDDALKRLLKKDNPEVDIIEKMLPDSFIYGFHDSGENPKVIQPGIKNIITPGSFIDKGSREKDGKFLPPDGSIDFTEYNFDGITFEWKWESNETTRNCKINIHNKNNSFKLEDLRTDEFKSANNGVDYFPGNNIKNSFFNKNNTNKPKEAQLEEAKKYIIGKELGDTSQVVFARQVFIESNNIYNADNCCMFTVDNVIAVRCKLLGIPCCVRDYGKNELEQIQDKKMTRLVFYQPVKDPEINLKNFVFFQINEAIKNNLAVKQSIYKAYLEGFSYGNVEIQGMSQPEYTYVKKYFDAIVVVINKANEELKNYEDEYEAYKSTQEELGIGLNDNKYERLREIFTNDISKKRIHNIFKLIKNNNTFTLKLIHTRINLFIDSKKVDVVHLDTLSEQLSRLDIYFDSIKSVSDVIQHVKSIINRKTIHEQISYLLKEYNPRKPQYRGGTTEHDNTIEPEQFKDNLETFKTAQISQDITTLKKRYSLTKETNMEITREDIINTYFKLYDLDIIILLNNLRYLKVKSQIFDRYATEFFNYKLSNKNETTIIDITLQYIEDFVFFLAPIFRFLGEATLDIKELQGIHDKFYEHILEQNNDDSDITFAQIIHYYYENIIQKRNPKTIGIKRVLENINDTNNPEPKKAKILDGQRKNTTKHRKTSSSSKTLRMKKINNSFLNQRRNTKSQHRHIKVQDKVDLDNLRADLRVDT